MVLFNISKEETLIKLWEGTKTIGLGFIHSDRKPTIKDVKEHFKKYGDYIDYFYGRPIKVDFSKYPNLNSIGYNRDAGSNKMELIAEEGTYEKYVPTKTLNNSEIRDLKKKCKIDIYKVDTYPMSI